MPIPATKSEFPRMSAKDLVYTTLSGWIVDGTLKPGEKLLDKNIAEYFSVSRTPVREALLALSDQDLVEILPGKSTVVSCIDPSTFRNLYCALACINADALRLAFPLINGETIDELVRINEKIKKLEKYDDFYLRRTADMEFHQVFFDLAGNPYLQSFKDELDIHSARIENYFHKMDSSKSYTEHGQIIECLRNHDLDGAILAMRNNCSRDLSVLMENWNQLSDPHPDL